MARHGWSHHASWGCRRWSCGLRPAYLRSARCCSPIPRSRCRSPCWQGWRQEQGQDGRAGAQEAKPEFPSILRPRQPDPARPSPASISAARLGQPFAVIRDDWWIAAPASDGRCNPLRAGRGHAVACPRAGVRLGVAVMGLGVIARVTVTPIARVTVTP